MGKRVSIPVASHGRLLSPIPRQPRQIPRTPSPIALPPSPSLHPSSPLLDPYPPASTRPTDIPWRTLIPLLILRVADASTYAVIFPFVTDMITSFDVRRDRIGLYAGTVEGILMLVEAIIAPTWARLADKYGRKPVILLGYLFPLVGAAMVGFSTTVWQVILWRGIFGLNSVGCLARVMISESTTVHNRAKVFAIFSPIFSVGTMMGQLWGGELAHPYGRLPCWLGGTSEFFREWPFGLPGVVSAAWGLFATIVAWLYLEETRHPGIAREDEGDSTSSGRPWISVLSVPSFKLLLAMVATGVVGLTSALHAFDAFFAVYTYTRISDGGLGISVSSIGILMAITSLCSVIATPWLLPKCVSAWGEVASMRCFLAVWLLNGLTIPVTQFLASRTRVIMWFVLLVQAGLKTFANFAWPLSDVLVLTTLDEYPNLLATGAAVNLIAGALGRAVGPIASGGLFSLSTRFPAASLGRQLSWTSFLLFATVPSLLAKFIPLSHNKNKDQEAVPLVDSATRQSFDEEDA